MNFKYKNLKFLKFSEEIEILSQENENFRKMLARLENGTPDTPRSWFYENVQDPDKLIRPVVNKLNGMNKDLKNIADWDLGKLPKYGPQGGSAPLKNESRLDSLNEYFSHLDSPQILNDPIWKKAKQIAIKRLKFNQSGHPISVDEVIDKGLSGDKYNTSSCYPLFMKRKKPEAIADAKENAKNAIKQRFPSVLGTRASMGKTGEQARCIFMASMDVNVWGQRYQIPLQEYVRSLGIDFFTPWEGWEIVQEKISQNWKGNLKFGADYTKMDQHFNKHHGLECYDVIKHYFRKEYWAELKEIIEYVFTLPIITNLGILDQEHSMPSGSEWTNFLETMWNYIFSIYLELKWHLKFACVMGIGDDQEYILDGYWNKKEIEWVINTVIAEFERAGLPGNKDKQEVSMDETGFLQRYCCSNWSGLDNKTTGAGIYSLIRNVTSQVFPEFYHNKNEGWDKRMFALRVIMIAENANQHPLFEWYVTEFIAKANDNILEFIREGKSTWLETERRARSISNFIPTYNQANQKKSIDQFETVKLLMKVA